MAKRIYAYVGNWSFEPHPAKGKGISIFDYEPESGALTLRASASGSDLDCPGAPKTDSRPKGAAVCF